MKIAIAGFGVEGQASLRYYATDPSNDLVIFDESEPTVSIPSDVRLESGQNAFDRIANESFDKVLRTPSLPLSGLEGVPNVTSATREFFAQCPAQIIGITGTKGKGTTASLIAAILRADGRTVHLVGNIGDPALDILPVVASHDIVVYELSSFQLWDLGRSPHISVLLMIEPDHLDRHPDFADYVNAKANITLHQKASDTLVYNNQNDISTQIAIQSVAQKIPFPDQQYAHQKDGSFWYGEQKLCSVSLLKLPGNHNIDNACAAISATWSYVQNGDTIGRGLSSFDGLPHRLKFVRDIEGVRYYDDSIATTPGSAIAALRSFDQPKVLILGGSDKGSDLVPLYDAILAADVRHVVTIGTLGQTIRDALLGRGYQAVSDLGFADMASIVGTAQAHAVAGDVVIMSPACASLDMFKSYSDRGEQYVAVVEAL